MPGDARREAERPPWLAVIGTITLAPLFAGAVIVLGPYLLSGWRLDAPFYGWAPSRWIGVALVILPIPPLLDFLLRFVHEGHGTPAPFAPPRRLVVSGPFRYVRNPAYLCAVSIIAGQGLTSTSVLVYAAVVALAFHLFVVSTRSPRCARRSVRTTWPAAARCLGGFRASSLGFGVATARPPDGRCGDRRPPRQHSFRNDPQSRAPAAELGCDPKTLRSRLGRGEAVRIPDAPP